VFAFGDACNGRHADPLREPVELLERMGVQVSSNVVVTVHAVLLSGAGLHAYTGLFGSPWESGSCSSP
jgi:hypothetical protein